MSPRIRTSRRGGIYLLVMVGSATVTTIALVGLSLSAERRQAAQRAVNAQGATQLAHASIELGLHTIATDPSWRWTYGDGWWFTNRSLDGGRLALAVVDRDGGSITDAPCRPVVLRGVGIQGTSRTMLEVELEPESIWPDDGLTVAKALGAVHYWRFGAEEEVDKLLDPINDRDAEWLPVLPTAGAESLSCDTTRKLNGIDQFVGIKHNTDFDLEAGTVAFWYIQTGDVERAGLFGKDELGFDKGGHTTVLLDGPLVFTMESLTKTYTATGRTTPAPGEWHHVAITFGPDGMWLYLDGSLEATNSYTAGWKSAKSDTDNSAPIALGANAMNASESGGFASNPTDFLEGAVAHLSIFDRQLSEGEVVTLMDAQRRPSTMRIVPGSWRRVTE